MALIADILGTIISGYGVWFPPIALGPVMVAVISGLSTKYIFKSDLTAARDTWKVLVTVIVAGILNSFVIGTITTSLYSIIIMGNTKAFGALLLYNLGQRLVSKPLTIVVDAVLVALVNKAVYKPVIQRIVSRA